MTKIKLYHATDRRLYDGCPSDDLERELKSKADARAYLATHDIRITYFPNGGFYIGFKVIENHAPKIITQDCPSFEQCVNDCIKYIERTQP